ncbi:Uncharacterised protein r2_g1587 [Pycnogonum litorale]
MACVNCNNYSSVAVFNIISALIPCFNGSSDCGIRASNNDSPSTTTDTPFKLLRVTDDDTVVYFSHPEEMLIPWKINQYFIPVMITYAVTFIIGVIGNVTVIAVMLSDRVSQNVTHVFLVSLAVSDLLLLLICVPLDVAQYLVVQLDKNGVVCKIMSFAEMLSAFASVLNLSAVSLERFIVIVFPMRSRSLCTMSNCRRSLFVVWIVSVILAAPFIVGKDTTKSTYTNLQVSVTLYLCQDNTDIRRLILSVYGLLMLFIFPLLLMIVCYSWVINELWVSTKTMAELTQSSSESNELINLKLKDKVKESVTAKVKPYMVKPTTSARLTHRDNKEIKIARQQVIKMLILVVFLFLICWGPRVIVQVMIATVVSYNHGVYTTRIISLVLPFVHSCFNPIVYGFMSSNFRRMLSRSCDRTCGCSIFRLFCVKRSKSDRQKMHASRSYSSCSAHSSRPRVGFSCNYSLTTEVTNIKASEVDQCIQ